jgi:hypothetical protein
MKSIFTLQTTAKRAASIAAMILAMTLTNVTAQAYTFTMVDCLSEKSSADIMLHLKDIKTTELGSPRAKFRSTRPTDFYT